MAEFKDMLVYYRKRDGLSQRELAKALNVSASTVGMYESGRRFPEKEIEEAIADLFNVSLNELRGISQESISNQAKEDVILIKQFHRLNDSNKKVLLSTLNALLEAQDIVK